MLKQSKILIVVLLVANLLVGGLYWYLDRDISTHTEKAVLAAGDLDFEVKKEEKLKSTDHIIKDTVEDRAELDTLFVSDDDVVGFIREIEILGQVAGVSVIVKTVAVIDDESKFAETLSLRLENEGSWANSMHFLSLVEALPYFIFIDRYNINKGGSGEWTSGFDLNVLKKKRKNLDIRP